LGDFAAASSGVFQPEACVEEMLREQPEDWEAPYLVQFIHADRLYRINARNLGDWYDVERIVLACNRALSDAGERRRFIQLASHGQCASFVCITREQAEILRERFHVTFDDTLDSAMRKGKEFEERVIQSMNDD
jgi:hypothetical protein